MILPKLHRLNNLEKTPTTLLVCDLQEKFQPAIKNFSRVSKIVCRLIFACQKFEIKCLVTEQYPKGLGKTDPLIIGS